MGTRGTIRINGKLMFAVHWDAYPESLGAELVEARQRLGKLSTDTIMEIAARHSIDAADVSVLARANKLMLSLIKDRNGYKRTWQEDNLLGTGNFVIPISEYDDYSEWEYDINTKTGIIKVTKLSGPYKSRKRTKSFYI